ncbi:MAG: hypothetical protein AB7U05_03350 [Mangrovibacterium sp.]
MKQINILAFFFALTLLFGGCEDTNENLVGSRGIAVVPVISELTPESPVFSDLEESSFVTFTVDLMEGDVVDDAEIQVVYEGKTGIMDKIQSFPASFNITAPEMLAALGISESDVSLGTSFYIYVITTSQGLSTRSLASIQIKLPCEYDPGLAYGSYAVTSDWYATGGGKISIAIDETDPYIVYVSGLEVTGGEGLVEDQGPLKMVIDPATFNVTVANQILSSDAWGYGPIHYEGTGTFNSCEGNYNMIFTISIPGIDYTTTYPFSLTRE